MKVLQFRGVVLGLSLLVLQAGVVNAEIDSNFVASQRKLAEQGLAKAQYNLGVMYDKGRGVPQDYKAAVEWFRKAAEQGIASAQFNLGNMYNNGRGVPQDYAKAVEWYRKAAEQGDADAQFNLGNMYIRGKGVPQSLFNAYAWYSVASVSGDEDSTAQRDLVAEKLSREDLSKAQAEAARLHALIEKNKGE